MQSCNRLCVFVHFDKDNLVDDYVYEYLRGLRQVASKIIFVTTSKIADFSLVSLEKLCDQVIVRENIGYDFFSWKTGLNSMNIDKFDEIILANDSCYGPLFSLENVFNKMSQKKCDFWGITYNLQIQYHLQSYFLVFRKSVVQSEIFDKFWSEMKIIENKSEIIQNYEVGLSQQLIQAGFKPCSFFEWTLRSGVHFVFDLIRQHKQFIKGVLLCKFLPNHPIAQRLKSTGFSHKIYNNLFKINFMHNLWRSVLLSNCPFVKIELLRDNPLEIDLRKFLPLIRRTSAYPEKLILNHLSRFQKPLFGLLQFKERHKQ
jgi:lipopolysaccharide biosynthesis protein